MNDIRVRIAIATIIAVLTTLGTANLATASPVSPLPLPMTALAQ